MSTVALPKTLTKSAATSVHDPHPPPLLKLATVREFLLGVEARRGLGLALKDKMRFFSKNLSIGGGKGVNEGNRPLGGQKEAYKLRDRS